MLLQAEGVMLKHRLAKFKGIKKENFLLHLKECEFRYNNSKDTKTFYHILLKMIKKIHLTYLEPNKIYFKISLAILYKIIQKAKNV